jgi:predicted site-specific integrase-resolvase
MFVPLRKARERLGLHGDTLRRYADDGFIKSIRTKGGKRLFEIDEFISGKSDNETSTICYCRVSSPKQKDDLQRQITYMQERFPNAEIISDIGSGINYKRKGLNTILERAMQGNKLKVVVAYKDRLARFGAELIENIINKNGGEVLVLNRVDMSPEQELSQDILQILHVFSCRINGMRKYCDKIKEDKDIPKL